VRRIDKRTICSLRVAFAFLSAVASCTERERRSPNGPTNEQSDFIRLDETGVAKLRTSEAEARSLATDDAFKRLGAGVPAPPGITVRMPQSVPTMSVLRFSTT